MYEDALVTLNKDKKLKKIISSVGECKIRTISNPFEALIEAIITQQISDSAGKAISLRFKNLFPLASVPALETENFAPLYFKLFTVDVVVSNSPAR